MLLRSLKENLPLTLAGSVMVLIILFLVFGGKEERGVSDPTLVGKQDVETKGATGTSSKKVEKYNKRIMENEQNVALQANGAIITTSFGDIEVEFAKERAPQTVANFVTLVNKKYYDGIKFHRVISGFMIQAGDPLTKDESKAAYWGTGGPGYTIPDELSGDETYPYGTLAMARTQAPNSGGSQFFIVSANPKVDLPPQYTVFGKVIGGMDIVERIQSVATDRSNDRPLQAVTIESVTLK